MVSPLKWLVLPLVGVAVGAITLTFLPEIGADEKHAPAPKKAKDAAALKKGKDAAAHKKGKDAAAPKKGAGAHVPTPGVGLPVFPQGRPGHLDDKLGAAAKVEGAEARLEEANVMRKAYILLAGGNHDYDGHRVKAMHALKEGMKPLNEHVMAHGSAAQKVATEKGIAAVARADEAAKKTQILHEPQPASDAALRGAKDVLTEVRTALVERKQEPALGHVEGAIKELHIALKIR